MVSDRDEVPSLCQLGNTDKRIQGSSRTTTEVAVVGAINSGGLVIGDIAVGADQHQFAGFVEYINRQVASGESVGIIDVEDRCEEQTRIIACQTFVLDVKPEPIDIRGTADRTGDRFGQPIALQGPRDRIERVVDRNIKQTHRLCRRDRAVIQRRFADIAHQRSVDRSADDLHAIGREPNVAMPDLSTRCFIGFAKPDLQLIIAAAEARSHQRRI